MRIFEIIKENVNLREAAELYGIDVNRYGKALCPFHNDRHPSLYVADDHYYCFACGEHGDVIDFVGRLFQLSPYNAARKLMADFHLSPDKPPSAAALHAKRIRTEAQQLMENERLCFSVLSDYARVLRDWKMRYTPQSPDVPVHAWFVEACHKLDQAEYYLDILCAGDSFERAEVVQQQMAGGKLDRLRQRLEKIHKEEIEDGYDTAGVAIYHLEAKIVSRGAGRSAVAAAAYLSCSRMLNEYDGVQHDYTRKQGLGWRQVFLPATAPAEWQDRETLWNAVEETETAKDSRLAREFVAALPIELSREEQIQLLQDFIKEQFVADGMCADAAIHDPYPPGHNSHAHILLTVRPLDEKGKWQYKTEKEYLCVKDGEERGFTAAEFKQAQADGWEKQYQYKVGKKKVYMTPSAAQAQGYERISK